MQEIKIKAVTLPAYQGNIIRALRSLEMKESEVPQLLAEEVLIEISAAPANPSDLAFIQGGYNVKKTLPAIPGFEGCGRVVQTGSSDLASRLQGKFVSFFSQSDRGGSWSSHIPVSASDCIALDEAIPLEQAACFAVNPFTAYAMVELAEKSGSKAIIQNAAAGQVGKFINVLADRAGMSVINIVRKEEQIELLQKSGFTNILWSQDENFIDKLSNLANSLEATTTFDAVGGEMSGRILGAMPAGSTLYLYGALGGRTLSEIPASDVIFKKKSITGFNMNEWKEELSSNDFEKVSHQLQEMFLDGSMKTDIQASFPLLEIEKALMQYIRGMSAGKVLLIP
jgi:NADPH2:quinone reductase